MTMKAICAFNVKKKHISFFVIFAVLLSFCPTFNIVWANSENVIFSDSFEKGSFLNNWEYMNDASLGFVRVTDSCSTDGKKSLYIWDEKSDGSVGIQSVRKEITSGKTYTVTADIYRKSATLYLYLKYYTEDNVLISSATKARSASGSGWKNYAISQLAPQDAKYIEINLVTSIAPEGYGYYDNIKIIEGEVSVETTVSGTNPPADEDIFIYEDLVPSVNDLRIFHEGFEYGLGNWTDFSNISDLSVKVSTSEKSSGANSLYFYDNSETETPEILSSKINVKEGEEYIVSAKGKRISGAVAVNYKFYNEDDTVLESNPVGISANGNNWYHASKTVTAPEGASYLRFLITGYTNTLGEWYIDDIELTKVKDIFCENKNLSYYAPKQADVKNAEIVSPDNDKLTYNAYNMNDDKLGDYSYAGFLNGEYELPVTENLPVYEEIYPVKNSIDDTERIQSVIDKASKYAGNGMLVIKLKAGKYRIGPHGLKMKSGVIISGEGQGPSGTVLHAYAPVQHTVITASGSEPTDVGDKVFVTDSYIKAGSKTVNVSQDDVSKFKVGDLIAFRYPYTDEWVDAMGMNETVNMDGNITSWYGKVNPSLQRTVTAVNGTQLTLDFPFFIPYDQNYNDSENKTYIVKVDDSGNCKNLGVENLRIESYYNGDIYDEKHALHGIALSGVSDAFVRNVTGKHLYSSVVRCTNGTKRVTVLNCSSLEPVSKIDGDRRYAFYASSDTQQILFTGCYSQGGRHDFATSNYATGPIAFVDNVVDGSYHANETHALWSTGVLYDNVRLIPNGSEGFIGLANRGKWGTESSGSHGWTAAGSVVWNSLANAILVHKPPLTYQNFAVGTYGIYTDTDAMTNRYYSIIKYMSCYGVGSSGYTDANFSNVEPSSILGDSYSENQIYSVNPKSLFKAQFAERMTGSINNARPNSPTIVYPACDLQTTTKNIVFDGFCDKGADKVTIYVDDTPHSATINETDWTYKLTLTLTSGTHKIYATQTIDGKEGMKTADRFISVDCVSSDITKLQSVYEPSKTTLLLNDTRESYDEHLNENSVYFENNISGVGAPDKPYIIDTPEKFTAIFGKNNNNEETYDKGIYYKITEDLIITEHTPNKMIFQGVLYADKNKTITFLKIPQASFYLNEILNDETLSKEFGINEDKNKNKNHIVCTVLFPAAKGAVIKNITLNGTMVDKTCNYVGTFVAVAHSTVIENCVNNIDVPYSQSAYNGRGAAGGFVGMAREGTKFIDCINNGDLKGKVGIGGIVGDSSSNETISGCKNYGDVISEGTWAATGGIVGCQRINTVISQSANFGNVTSGNGANSYSPGGIIGYITNYGTAKTTVSECMNVGNVTAQLSTAYPASIIGETVASVEISDSFNLGSVTGGATQGRVIGKVSGSNLISSESITVRRFYDSNISNSGNAKATNTNAKVTMENVYGLSETPDDNTIANELTKVSADTLKSLISSGTFLTDIWEMKSGNTYPYPTLKNNPYFIVVPDKLTTSDKVFTSDSGENIKVEGTLYYKYALIAGKAPVTTGFNLKEFGVIVGDLSNLTFDNCTHKLKARSDKIIQPSGAFGCLLYNTVDTVNGFENGHTYYIRPYAIYEDIIGGQHKVYGTVLDFTFKADK